MSKGYWIVRVDITDHEQYKQYMAANAEPFKKFGARFLVRGGRFENPEGASRSRTPSLNFRATKQRSNAGSHLSINAQSNFANRCPRLISSSLKVTMDRSLGEARA